MALVQSRRCTEIPSPRVTKPRISSPGTGVQHRASFTSTSVAPLTTTPESWPAVLRRRGRVIVTASARSSAAPSSPPETSITLRTTVWAPRLPSPTAAYSAETSATRSSLATWVSDSWVITRLRGRPSLRSSRPICSLPCSMASSRRSLVNQWRILLRARGDFTNCSQSRDGPAFGRLGGEHLDDVAVLELGLERHQAAVDPGADGVVPDLGVDRVGEVDRGRADRQPDHVAARGEHEHLGAVDLEAQRVEELPRVLDLVLPVEQLAQPLHVGVGAPRWPCPRCRRARPPCTSSARRRRTPPGGACRSVRICISTGLPDGPITVVCSDWYMLNFGIAT